MKTMIIIALASSAMGIAVGCSTLKSDAHDIEGQILRDGHAVGKVVVQDGQKLVTLADGYLQMYLTNAEFRASVDKDIAAVAVTAAK